MKNAMQVFDHLYAGVVQDGYIYTQKNKSGSFTTFYPTNKNGKVVIPNHIVSVIYEEESRLNTIKLRCDQINAINKITNNKFGNINIDPNESKANVMFHSVIKKPVGLFFAKKIKDSYNEDVVLVGWSSYRSNEHEPFDLNKGIIFADQLAIDIYRKFYLIDTTKHKKQRSNTRKMFYNIPENIRNYFPKFIKRALNTYRKNDPSIKFSFSNDIKLHIDDEGKKFIIGTYKDIFNELTNEEKSFWIKLWDDNRIGWEDDGEVLYDSFDSNNAVLVKPNKENMNV